MLGLLGVRYLLIRSGNRQAGGGGVQRLEQKPKGRPLNESFLPGSRTGSSDQIDGEKDQKSAKGSSKKKRRVRPFTSKADIKRSYIKDALLERPKF